MKCPTANMLISLLVFVCVVMVTSYVCEGFDLWSHTGVWLHPKYAVGSLIVLSSQVNTCVNTCVFWHVTVLTPLRGWSVSHISTPKGPLQKYCDIHLLYQNGITVSSRHIIFVQVLIITKLLSTYYDGKHLFWLLINHLSDYSSTNHHSHPIYHVLVTVNWILLAF